MTKLRLLIAALFALLLSARHVAAAPSYSTDPTYQALYASMHTSFNAGDSTKFFVAVKELQDYLLQQDDLHAYYTQRCNEIVFLMNRQKVFEAYKLAKDLSRELREKKLDKEMYMAINMLGHIYRYCGNKDMAVDCWLDVLKRQKDAGYYDSMPAIYMNIVGVITEEAPNEALRLTDEAISIARQYSPQRVFDIETRRTLIYYSMQDTTRFLEGYAAYEEGVQLGFSSVHGREIEVYHLAILGRTDEAVQKSRELMGYDSYSTVADIYQKAGRWHEAFLALSQDAKTKDSLNSVILSNNMEGIRTELSIYDNERSSARIRTIMLVITIVLLGLLVISLAHIVWSRRRHLRQLKSAYQHALESDNLKTAFIQNVSHEVRTPLNIISGFAQVLANPAMETSHQQRKDMAQMMMKNTHLITSLIDEMLELSVNESTASVDRDDKVRVNQLLHDIATDSSIDLAPNVKLEVNSALADDFEMQTSDRLLRRIIGALANNAVKNTNEGTITLKARTDDESIIFTVEDTGIGIPSDEAEHVFERFVKLDTFKPGIGLGLTLCRTLAKRLGGTVILDTTYTTGARFIVALPLKQA